MNDHGVTWAPRIVVSRASYDGGYVTVANRVRRAFGIDIFWRESKDSLVGDQDTIAVLYANIPYSLIVGVTDASQPLSYLLLNNYPNPFNPSTKINYSIPERDNVKIIIYDLLGRVVANLVNEEIDAGDHSIVWNGTNNDKAIVTSGVYFARLITSNAVKTIKMMLIK